MKLNQKQQEILNWIPQNLLQKFLMIYRIPLQTQIWKDGYINVVELVKNNGRKNGVLWPIVACTFSQIR